MFKQLTTLTFFTPCLFNNKIKYVRWKHSRSFVSKHFYDKKLNTLHKKHWFRLFTGVNTIKWFQVFIQCIESSKYRIIRFVCLLLWVHCSFWIFRFSYKTKIESTPFDSLKLGICWRSFIVLSIMWECRVRDDNPFIKFQLKETGMKFSEHLRNFSNFLWLL